MSTERVEFPGAGGQALSGRLHRPPGRPRAVALFAHCFTCTQNIKAAVRFCQALEDEGIAVLRFDFTGLGASEGDFADTTFSSNVEDLVAAAAFLRGELGAPAILVGHSLGGAAVLRAAHAIPECTAVATLGAPFDPAHVKAHLGAEDQRRIEAEGEAEVKLAGRPFRVKKAFLDDLTAQRSEEVLQGLRRALLVMHSPVDDLVGIENAARIYQAARHPKSFVTLDDADHLLSRPRDAAYAARTLATWVSRYLPEEEPEPDPGEAGAVVVAGGREGYRNQVVVDRKHRMWADEPPEVGGADSGPTPYGYLLAGLGACTSMTLRMYADRKQWALEHVRVTLRHDKVHATDCERCDTEKGKIDRITRRIELTGELDESQRARLLEIADRCPVHRTLHSEVWIESELA